MASLAQWMVALSQGLVFFHAGDELLRSKSLDRDSYDSGAGSACVIVPERVSVMSSSHAVRLQGLPRTAGKLLSCVAHGVSASVLHAHG